MEDTPGPAALHHDHTEKLLAAIRDLDDPLARINAVNDVRFNNQLLLHQLAGLVRENVREMKKTKSYGEIAAELGVSRARVQQLAADD